MGKVDNSAISDPTRKSSSAQMTSNRKQANGEDLLDVFITV